MYSMKKVGFLLIIVLGLLSCEKDDFCTDPKKTPKLVLRFYDKDVTTDIKQAQRLSIIAQGKTDSLVKSQTTDSIAIPLNTITNQTIYTLKINNDDGNVANNKLATLTIQYIPEEEFVSRSCGFRVIFNTITLNSSGDWIDSLSTTTIATINNENNAHVKVYH